MFTENVQKGYRIITKKEEPLPLSENFPKAKRNVHVKESETATQRKTFENLTNKFTNLDSVPSTTATTNFDEQPCSPNESSLNANERNTRKVAVYIERNTTNILVTTKTVHPEVVEKCVELQLAESLQSNKNRKVYNLEINLKENHNLAKPLSVSKRGSKSVLSNVDEVTLNKWEKIANDSNIPTALKPSLAKRKRIITEDDELQSALRATVATAKVITAECNGKGDQINTRKRACIMSLYERRYQGDEPRGGQQGAVGNGYLGSARNSSAATSAIQSDANTDISNQYYIATSSANSSAPASGLVNGSAPNYAPSMATLCNIGNTCYLNSVVYTLRFAPKFVHNLHHLIVDLSNIQQNIGKHRANKSSSLGRNISGAQMENARSWSSKDLASFDNYNVTTGAGGSNYSVSQVEPQKTSQQLLTEKLHELYQNLHRNEIAESAEPFHADILLHAIQDVSSIFEGNQQQDAHEFLMCVLNSIRETCQTLIKAIADYPDAILNGCSSGNGALSCNEQVDTRSSSASDKDARLLGIQIHGVGGGGNTGSNLSTSSITKTSFFSRKSKRKEESKSSKNQRLQSPLKDTGSQSQSGSNSLFYLNTVDLSAANGKQQPQTNSRDSHANSNSTTTASTLLSNSIKLETQQQSGDNFESPTLKDKEHLAEKIRQLGLDFFRDDFEGITVSSTKCLSCETITEQKEIMIDIAVPVPISGIDNTDYMDKSTSFIQNSCITREYFRGENKYRCEQCTGYTEAIRSISYEVLPRLLVIQLSRFSGGMEKINSYIPTSFTLQCFCAKCCKLNDENKLHTYKLYSVITHVGATMSVGHYIAYTCCLDWANEYINCPKDLRRNQQFGSGNALQNTEISATSVCNVSVGGNSITTSSQSSAASAAASALASSGTSLIKKMKFGRSKASSSGDMSKNVKNLNGVTSRTITNGIGQLSMNATCHSIRCCATRFGGASEAAVSNSSGSSTTQPATANSTSNFSNVSSSCSSGLYLSNSSDLNEESITNGSSHQGISNISTSFNYNTSGYGSTGRGSGAKATYSSFSPSSSTSTEPIWYMCDDDKIKAMSQREFEELLSPSRKITITPYLLFYTRIDLQTSAAESSQPPTKQAQSQATAWSPNDAGAAFLQRVHMDKM